MKTLLLVAVLLPIGLAAQNRYDVVIDEIMADPTPAIGLPDNEWIELKNTSPDAIDLQGWRIGDAGGQSGPMPAYVLQPDSFVIVCTRNAVSAMSTYGSVINVTSFPSLNNDGEQLFLQSKSGSVIHAVAYSAGWYANEVKKDGGWSLEMIDTKNPCGGVNNWKASINTNGGTPGQRNSVDGNNSDNTGPQLKNAFVKNNQTIVVVFDEPVDSLSASNSQNYTLDGGLTITDVILIPPSFLQTELKVDNSIQEGIIYTITTKDITDCKGNAISTGNAIKTALPSMPASSDLVINEILFNPRSGGYDYVEFYNNSNKVFDAANLYLANRSTSGSINSSVAVSTEPFYIFPSDYIVATQDAANLQLNYLVKNPQNVLELSSLPSFPDNGGDVIVMNLQGAIIDEVKYDDDWHFKLIDNPEGVSLERIDPVAASQDAGNWHSAAATAGYGTPTYSNSQLRQTQITLATIEITPKVFSPDNDGHDDIAAINYKVAEQGFVANITIFDASGRPVRNLVRNGTMALSGYWNWDGLDDKSLKLPIGTYIIFTEFYNLQGKKSRFKNAIVLARRLN